MTDPNHDSAKPEREPASSQDIIDDALRMVDNLRRELLRASVRRGVSSTTTRPARTGDVWEEAVREEPEHPREPLAQLVDIARATAPEVARHLGQAGVAVAGAVGDAWQVIDQSLRGDSRRSDNGRPAGSIESGH